VEMEAAPQKVVQMDMADARPQKGSPQKCLFLTLFTILALVLVTLILSAVAVGRCNTAPTTVEAASAKAVNFLEASLGLPGYETLTWRDVLLRARGGTVRFHMYDWDIFNNWVDTVLTPRVSFRYGITVVRVSIPDAAESVALIAAERAAGNDKNGSVDLIWINGENFHAAKTAKNLYGPWTAACPNSANFDWSARYISFDDGTPTNGLEMPYNSVQNTYAYNPDYVFDNCTFDNVTNTNCLPRTMTDLLRWAIANPGRFTYPAPPDFHGTTFLKNVLVTIDDPSLLYGDFDATKYTTRAKMIFPLLKRMQNVVALDNATQKQPFSVTDSYAMFGSGQTWIVMTDNALDPGLEVGSGRWPANTRAFVPTTGTLTSTDFVAIGYNSPNALAAVVVGNEIADISMQFSRRQPDGLAQIQPLNPGSEVMTIGGWSVAFDAIKDADQTPPRTVLRAGAVAALATEYTDPLEGDWVKCVLGGLTVSPCL